jgi:uncharacterized protein involved in exopolysaccharide biosynthesis
MQSEEFSVMKNDLSFRDYLDVAKRRKFHFIIPCIVVFLAIVTIALMLPPVYKSTATIMVESAAVSEKLVRSNVTGYIEERIDSLSIRAQSPENLIKIIETYGLYTDLSADNTMPMLLTKMREDITIETIATKVQSERLGRTMPLTTSFTVSFDGKEAEGLADVANHLASLFLELNVKEREEKTRTTIKFLEKQLDSLRLEIQETEAKLADFKEQHLLELPHLMSLNLKSMDQMERSMEYKTKHINDLINRKIYLEGQLALLEPSMFKVTGDGKRILTPKEELSVLRSQYLSLSASLSEDHPDVIKLKKKLVALEGEVGTKQAVSQFQKELYDKEHQLALLQKRVSSKHPDAIKLKKEVILLREQVQKLSKNQKVLKEIDEKPENPAYINLQTKMDTTQMEIEAAKKDLEDIEGKHEQYRNRLEHTPKVEQEYLDLKRNYDNATTTYDKIANRLRVAREAMGLEQDNMAEKFTLIEPARTPLEPYKPNRPAMILLGLALALGSGIGVGSISEYMDDSIHTADELAKIAKHKVLTVIPYWETSHEITRKRRRIWVVVGSSVAIAVIGLVALNFLHQP